MMLIRNVLATYGIVLNVFFSYMIMLTELNTKGYIQMQINGQVINLITENTCDEVLQRKLR